RPRLLMLDEPSLGLAPLVSGRIFEVVREIAASGIAILLVEQNVHRALQVAGRGYVLELGRIVLQGSSAELLADDHIRLAYLGHGMGEGE
ncbi:MAG TPA: ABC transporter ATP-binding protein, partial [Candidatus Dormibacteraeota bacterium]|nr:ABC transporter ATP-binding protein [Candidatus Dormibacteraeota bacterium]